MRLLPVAILAAIAIAAVGLTLLIRVPTPLPLNYVEGFTRLAAADLAEGIPLYADPANPPWAIHTYTPLFTGLVALADRLGADGFAAGRLFSYASLLATALLIGATGWRSTGLVAWAVAAIYLTQPLFALWGALVRPDSLAILFSTLGVVVVDRCRGARRVLLALAFFLAAGLTKQTAVAGLLASVLWLILTDRKQALALVALGLVLGALAVGSLQLATDGWFLFHTVRANVNPFSWQQLQSIHLEFASANAFECLAGLALLVFASIQRRVSIYTLWLACSLLTTVSAGKVGADFNYFMEPLTALAMLAAHALPSRLPRGWSQARRATATLLLTLLLSLHGFADLRVFYDANARLGEAGRHYVELIDRLPSVAGPVVSDDAGILLMTGKRLLIRPFIMTQLALAGLWDQRPFVEMLQRREVDLIIFRSEPLSVHHSRYTPEMRAAIAEHYRHLGGYQLQFRYEVYTPRPALHQRAP